MKKQLALFFLGVFCTANAQDPHFNNVNQSLVYLNPSFSGSEKCVRNQTNYRNQWPNLSGAYVTYQSCFDGYIKPIKGGIALRVISDDLGRGTLRRTGIALSYAQYIKVSDYITLVPSIQGSYNQSTLDKARLNFGDYIDARYGIMWSPLTITTASQVPTSSLKYSDLAAGFIVRFFDYGHLGVSFSNLLEPNISHLGTYHLPVKTNVHLLYNVAVNPMSKGYVSLIATFQNSYYNARMNVIINGWRGLTYGLGYGVNNNFWGLENSSVPNTHHTAKGFLGYSRERFNIIYSYDRYLKFKYSGNSAGSHELSLEIKFKKKETTKSGSISDLK